MTEPVISKNAWSVLKELSTHTQMVSPPILAFLTDLSLEEVAEACSELMSHGFITDKGEPDDDGDCTQV